MMPDGVLSTQAILGDILPPRDRPKELLVDYDYGPVAFSDQSGGMKAKVWTGTYQGGSIVYSADGVADQVVLTTPNVNELSITFDQNGRPAFAYCDDLGSHLHWFNTLTNQYETLDVGLLAYNPRVMLDDKRDLSILTNDILFCYMLEGALHIRFQRDRFGVDNILTHVGSLSRLVNFGMNNKNRIQFNLEVAV